MKASIVLIATLLSTQAWAGTLPSGTFSGDGLWKSPMKEGTYQATTQITGDSIESSYTFEDGKVEKWSIDIVPTHGNFFKVEADGEEIGEGYCLEQAIVCHYEADDGDMSIEETLTLQGSNLYRFGSKEDSRGKVMWQESLK